MNKEFNLSEKESKNEVNSPQKTEQVRREDEKQGSLDAEESLRNNEGIHNQIKKELDVDYYYTQEQKDNLCECGHFSWNHYDLIGKCRKRRCSCNQFAKDKLNAQERK